MWDFSFSRFRTISQVFCPAQSGFSPVHQLGTLPKWLAERRVSYQGVDRWFWNSKVPTCSMLCIWESSKTWEPWSLYSQAQQNTSIGRGWALMFWVFPPKCRCWKSMTCWCKTTRRYLCKRVLPKCIEFILNLVKWPIWQPWRNAEARSHVLVQWITFQVCWNMSFPARPGKISISIEWCGWALRCIVFGVAVILETPRISDPTAFVASPSDHICWTPSSGLCMAACPSTSPPKALCQCNELRFSFGAVWVGGNGTTKCQNTICKSWRCGSTTIAGIQRSSREAFASISRKPFAGWFSQSWNKKCAGLEHQSDFVETRDIYNYIANIWIYTFCILKWMDLRHSLFVLDCQILSVWGPKTLPTQPTRLIREWNNFTMFRIARTLVVSVKFSSSLLDISSWR